MAVSYKFLEVYLQNLKYHEKGHVFFFWFWLVFYALIFLLRTGGWGGCRGDLLNRQHALSLTRVICQQSLKKINKGFGASFWHRSFAYFFHKILSFGENKEKQQTQALRGFFLQNLLYIRFFSVVDFRSDIRLVVLW